MPAVKFNVNQKQVWLKKIRHLRVSGAEYELLALRALLDFEQTPIAWKQSPSHKFEDVLKEERLFPVSRWRAFKRAVKAPMVKGKIEALGVQAACLIAAQDQKRQFKLIRAATGFRKKHGVDATFQYVGELLKKGRKRAVKGPARKLLLEYIETLKGTLQDHRLLVPAAPWLV